LPRSAGDARAASDLLLAPCWSPESRPALNGPAPGIEPFTVRYGVHRLRSFRPSF